MDTLIVLHEKEIRRLFSEELEATLERRIPAIIRQASSKPYMTTLEFEQLTGMSYRMQAYHRKEGNLPYSQDGRRIIYKTEDVERFIEDRRVEIK